MVSSLSPLYFTQQFFCSRLQDRLIQSWRIGYAAELVHPEVRRGELFFPLACRSVQEIHVPGLPLCPERLLPLLASEQLAVPIVSQSFVVEFTGARFCPLS